jgi:sugar O-acyltransferase (sialic acid O-acetyltransferase NeuD family)
MKVLLFGAGGHAQVVADALRAQQHAGEQISLAGYVDDNAALRKPLGVDVHGTIAEWQRADHDAVIVAIGDNTTRRGLFMLADRAGARFAIARHPASTVAPDARLGPGTMVCAGVVINTMAVIGANTIINTAASVDHHCRIEDHVHIAPGVRLGGNVAVGEGALVGIGAVVLPGKKIGAWAIVGAGAVVIDDVPPATTVVGVPARAVRTVTLIERATYQH